VPVTEACNLARNDGIDVLRHALLALAVTIAQLDSKTVNVPAVSFNYYLRALGGLRAGLKKGVASLSERQAETYLFTCLSCAIFEVNLPNLRRQKILTKICAECV
jgi:hypothetical protein